MNATAPANLRIASPTARTTVVSLDNFDSPLEVEYDYSEGEAAIVTAQDGGHPGSPVNAELIACRVGGVDIFRLLRDSVIENIEEAILEQQED